MRRFLDSNVLIYTATRDDPRRPKARDLLEAGGVISAQCLNEFAAVARRKLHLSWPVIHDQLESIVVLCLPVTPLTVDTHRLGLAVAERHQLSVYDGMIVAAALEARCDMLYSEDMHDGLLVDGRLTIINPFA